MSINIQIKPGQKIYFASDFHLGVPDDQSSLEREKKIVRWLNQCQPDMAALFLVGDIFDFWFEYRQAIPKGFIRLQGKLAEISDSGIPIYFFRGNHDMWMFDYFKKELDITIYSKPQVIESSGKKIYIHHGDGLGPFDKTYKFLKFFFRSAVCQWLFARLHPNLGIGMAKFFSKRSRIGNNKKKEEYLGEKEWLLQYSKDIEKDSHHDYYVYGHRHLPLELDVSDNSKYINLGEWVNYTTYGEFDGEQLRLKEFEKTE